MQMCECMRSWTGGGDVIRSLIDLDRGGDLLYEEQGQHGGGVQERALHAGALVCRGRDGGCGS